MLAAINSSPITLATQQRIKVMPKLRRSFSELFQGKKPEQPMPAGLTSLAEVPEGEFVSPPVFQPPLQQLDTLYEAEVQQVLVDSICERNNALEQEHRSLNTKAKHLEEQLQTKTDEVQGFQRDLSRLQRNHIAAIQTQQAVVESLKQEQSNVEQEYTREIADLKHNLKEYQVLYVKMDTAYKHLQEKADALEADNNALLQESDSPVAEAQREKAKFQKRLKALEAEVLHERSVREAGNRAYENLQNRIVASEKQNKDLSKKIWSLHQEMEAIEAASSRRLIQKLEEQEQRHEFEKQEASRVLGSDLTPRLVLVHKMFAKGSENMTNRDGPNSAMFLQSCSQTLLTNHLLDVQLDSQQARRFADNASIDELTLVFCDLCQRPKLAKRPNASPRMRINEFTKPTTSCCSKSICTDCYLGTVQNSLATDWWTNLGEENWLRCPTPSCNSPLPVSHREGLTNLLRQLGDNDMEHSLAMYDRIVTFRRALSKHPGPLSDESLTVACNLHTQLVSVGRMYSLFDPMFNNREPDHTGRIPPFNPGEICMVRVDHNGGSIQVPLFMRFIRRRELPRECAFCADELYDVDFGSVEEWLDLCNGFHGDWMWKTLLFPVKLGLECRHDIDFCTGCLEKHLKTQLEQYGRSKCDQLACPGGGCGRRLLYDEIRLYAEPDTFEEYDRYLNLNTLSQFPNFRWCLRAGCSSGQLYGENDDDDEPPGDPRIHCDACAFEMCYTHSMPWHEGQTCEQYDSVREHGDPEFQQTQDWITQNTKPCPGCRENIQKGEYCFHMTCSSCNYEFCWECLANWDNIASPTGEHNANAHGEGCPFRTNGLTPSQVSGTTLQEALRRRRR